MKISKETKIAEVVEKYPDTIEVFFKYGLHCIGCPASRMESIGDGCRGHGLDEEKINALVKELNKAIKKERID